MPLTHTSSQTAFVPTASSSFRRFKRKALVGIAAISAIATGSVGSLSVGSTALGSAVLGSAVLGDAIAPRVALAQTVSSNPEIKVGIVQRFGEVPNDKIILAPLAGDAITVSFETQGQPKTITTQRLQLDFAMQPLAQPKLEEWVVLSTHRSFESAEDSAKRWQDAGINAEIAQPDAWQVWAKRDDYNTPVVRRLLIENLHAAGYTRSFIDSRVIKAVPKVAFTADGFRYARETFNITTSNRRIQMNHGPNAGARAQFRDLYAGDMKIQPNSYGNYTLVNQVPVDAYLRGVVPHEIGASAPRTAIEAQTILARTYALRNLRRFAIDDYEICADTQCQVYFGLAETDPTSDSAIAATAGQVLTYNNELVDALYSSTTGGITARFIDVWNGEDRPYLQPVVDAIRPKWDIAARPLSSEENFRAFIALKDGFNEDGWPAFRWNRQASLKDIGTTMKEYLSNRQHPLSNFNEIVSLTVTERAASGRVQKIQVETDLGSFDLVKDEVVKALVPPRSLLFYLDPIVETTQAQKEKPVAGSKPKSENVNESTNKQAQSVLKGYRFIGGGFGHGVGMSQTGAYNLGKQGYSSEQILEFYYPGTQLSPLSASTVFYRER